jgi:hypothetical protein
MYIGAESTVDSLTEDKYIVRKEKDASLIVSLFT